VKCESIADTKIKESTKVENEKVKMENKSRVLKRTV
jgi:hypothetical protein